MTKLYAYGAAGPPAVDYRAGLAPTLYLKDYGAMPWDGTAGTGTSGAHDFATGSASAGATFGSHSSARLDGVSDFLKDLVDQMKPDLVAAASFGGEIIFNAASLAASNANPDLEPALLTDASGYLRLTLSASGVRLAIYPAGNTGYIPITPGVNYHLLFGLDSALAYVRLNGGAYVTGAAAGGVAGTDRPIIGSNYNGSVKVAADIALVMLRDSAFGSTVDDALYADAQAHYGV